MTSSAERKPGEWDGGRRVKIVVLSSFVDPLCRVRNIIMYSLSWRIVSALSRVLFRCLFPSLLRNLGNKHQNNPLLSAEAVHHSSTYIILYALLAVPQRQRQSISQYLMLSREGMGLWSEWHYTTREIGGWIHDYVLIHQSPGCVMLFRSQATCLLIVIS